MIAPTLLLVSSDPILHEDVRWQLGARAATVCVARDALAACLQISGKPDLELVIVHLDGSEDEARMFSVLRTLRSERRGASVVVVAEDYKAEEAGRLLRMGVADYLDRVGHMNGLGLYFASMGLPSEEPVSVSASGRSFEPESTAAIAVPWSSGRVSVPVARRPLPSDRFSAAARLKAATRAVEERLRVARFAY